MFNQTYELPLSADYVKSWGVTEAVREVCQNALDSDSPFEYTIDGDTLTVSSQHSTLEPRHLILGTSSKAENDSSIGQFGEGFKLAMLVLTREGKDVRILNGSTVWLPEFVHSKKYGCEILQVRTKRNKEKPNGLHFIISGLDQDELQAIYHSNLHMRPVKDYLDTTYGRILLEDNSNLYVNGLFVCTDEKLKYGYDIKPEHLKLDRDRRAVSSFDLQWIMSRMWLESQLYDFIAQELAEDVYDFKHIEYNNNDLIKEACYKRFTAEHGNAIAISSQAELDELAKNGITKTVFVSTAYSSSIKGAKSYVEPPAAKSPEDLMQEFFKQFRGEMRTKAIVAFKKLKPADWRLK